MSQLPEFDIVSLIELSRKKKYETVVVGFGILDKIDRIPISKKWKNRKVAVQALHALSENLVQYKYFSKEEQVQLKKDKGEDSSYTGENYASGFVPVAEDDMEEEALPEEAPRKLESLDGDSEGSEEEDEELDDEDEDEDEDED